MKKMAVCMVAVSLAVGSAYVSTAAATDSKAGSLVLTARMGGRFRTIDADLRLPYAITYADVYYLALAQGSPAPTSEAVIRYAQVGASDTLAESLTNGTAARGAWHIDAPDEVLTLSLFGAESVERLPGEIGLIDGYRYDLYLAVVGPDGVVLEAVDHDIMAQPFAAIDAAGTTVTVRSLDDSIALYPDLAQKGETARQLHNIQRLADLYAETQGVHGSADFLTNPSYTFKLETDFDLSGYNWTPIGHVDADPKFVFGGTFDGQGHTVRHLRLSKDTGRDGQSYLSQGLFGRTEGAVICNCILKDAQLQIVGDYGRDGCAVGALVGEMIGGSMEQVTVVNATVHACGPDQRSGYVGGVAGKITDARLRDITVNKLRLDASGVGDESAYAMAAGGVAGLMTAMREISSCTVTMSEVSGGAMTGGLVGYAYNGSGAMTYDGCRTDGLFTGYDYTGGLFGVACGETGTIVIENAGSTGRVRLHEDTQNGALGGMAGMLQGCDLSFCISGGPAVTYTRAGQAGIGGFVGVAADTIFFRCVSNREVRGAENTGGFLGWAKEDVVCRFCGVTGSGVFGQSNVGGFVGLAEGRALDANAGHTLCFSHCYAACDVVAKQGQAGGFAGRMAYASAAFCRATGDLRAAGDKVGGFCGAVVNMSRIANAYATGAVDNVGGDTGGFAGFVGNTSGIEYAYATGDVSGRDGTGGFAGAVSAYGAPNTLTGCFAFARWVVSPAGSTAVNRFVGRLDHQGVNACYAYLGASVVVGQRLSHVVPNAYGADAADVNGQTMPRALAGLGLDSTAWDAMPLCAGP